MQRRNSFDGCSHASRATIRTRLATYVSQRIIVRTSRAAEEPLGPLACMCASKRTQGVSAQGAQKRPSAPGSMPLQVSDLLQTRSS